MKVNEKEVELSLQDTAGQEDYDQLRPLSYPSTDVFLLMFSVVSKDSLDNVKSKWVKELRHFSPTVPIVLVGTKTDLREARADQALDWEAGDKMAKSIGARCYLECSALEQRGVKAIFDEAVEAILDPTDGKDKAKKQCVLL